VKQNFDLMSDCSKAEVTWSQHTLHTYALTQHFGQHMEIKQSFISGCKCRIFHTTNKKNETKIFKKNLPS